MQKERKSIVLSIKYVQIYGAVCHLLKMAVGAIDVAMTEIDDFFDATGHSCCWY